MFLTLQILALTAVTAIVVSWVKHLGWRLILAFSLSLFLCLELSAVYLTGQLIDNRFIQHLNFDDISGYAFQFKLQFLWFIFSLIAVTFLIVWLVRVLKVNHTNHLYRFIICSLLTVVLLLPNGVLPPIFQSFRISQAAHENLDQALADLNIPIDALLKPHQITAQPGKNIIVISLESVERGFLQPPLNKLTPTLTKLSTQWSYLPQIQPLPGSNWTAGSLYTHQTGMPALFNQQHYDNNNLFQSSENFQLTSLNHVLETAGYRTVYLIGKPEFAGVESILNTLGMRVVSEKNSLGTYPEAEPGLHDKDLFDEAKLQLNEFLTEPNKPFALFMSTINSHFPDGILDKRMLGMVPKDSNSLQFSVRAVDYLINDFLQYIESSGLAENTVIYIFPDHTLMGNHSDVIETLKQNERMLYLLSSAAKNKFNTEPNSPLFQIDLPRLILSGADVITNATFLTDFITPSQTAEFIANNAVKIAAVNHAALKRTNYTSGFTVSLNNNQLTVTGDKHEMTMTVKGYKPIEVYQFKFTQSMVPLEHEQISLARALSDNHIDPKMQLFYLQVHTSNRQINQITLSNRNGIEINKHDDFTFSAGDISALSQQVIAQTGLLNNQPEENYVAQYATDTSRFIAHAAGSIDGNKYTNSLEALDNSYAQGFRLFELDIGRTSDNQFVAVHDWPQWQKLTGYDGLTPPSHEDFMQYKILKQYTPLDMTTINAWFSAHPDTVLVTDKVNEPTAFSAQFFNTEQLMMELFSWEAVKEGSQMGLKAIIPTGELLFDKDIDIFQRLNDLDIKYIAASRSWVDSEPRLLDQLKQAGIKVMAFHVSFQAGKDETHVVCHENRYFYGLYADHWSFALPDSCG